MDYIIVKAPSQSDDPTREVKRFDYMVDLNIPADIAPAEQAPAIAAPTRTDDQILPSSKWVPMGKSNSVLDLDKQWFNLHKYILRDALGITPANDNNPFEAPPSSDTIIEYVNTLGYPSTLRNVSTMSVNALYQPWRAILSMINMCLTSKTAGFDRARHHVLQILWGITHHSNIDYAERIWEEFVQSIQTFLTDKKNLATEARGKKKTLHLLIPNVRMEGKSLHAQYLRLLLTDEITSAPYYSGYLEHVAEYQCCLDEEHGKAEKEDVIESPKAAKATKSKTAKQRKPQHLKHLKSQNLPNQHQQQLNPPRKTKVKSVNWSRRHLMHHLPQNDLKLVRVTKHEKPKALLQVG
ncbi:hypothetical protein Tco_1467037 [Tanacetum coccineum]